MLAEIKEKKFEVWRHGLLDISRRNRLMNFRKTKRTTLQITDPTMAELYKRLVVDAESLSFRRQLNVQDDQHLSQLFYLFNKMGTPIELSEGEIQSTLGTAEMGQTLKNLRSRSKLSLEEQGINTLYLAFGFLRWRRGNEEEENLSPLVLVPVRLELESMASPYYLSRLEEDIVINPTLDYVLTSEFGITLPELDASSGDIHGYLDQVQALVSSSGWGVEREVDIGLVSFLKIVMYKDLAKYKERIFQNPVIQAFCGDPSALPALEDSLRELDHDKVPAADICQVVNADASQQDAIALSRQGISFVLQGPPGTGKSQTITNIIAQALADGKKVLFVSEKMAALSVVYQRLQDVGLADYCLSLHNYKAERQAVIADLIHTLDAPTVNIKRGILDALSSLEEERGELNAYIEALYEIREPLHTTILDALTLLLTAAKTPYWYAAKEPVLTLTEAQFQKRLSTLQKLSDLLAATGPEIYANPWRGTQLTVATYEVRQTVMHQFGALVTELGGLKSTLAYINQELGLDRTWSLQDFQQAVRCVFAARLDKSLRGALYTLGIELPTDAELTQLLEQHRALRDAYTRAQSLGLTSASLENLPAIDEALEQLHRQQSGMERAEQIIEMLNLVTPIVLTEDYKGACRGRDLLRAIEVPYPVMDVWFAGGQYEAHLEAVVQWRALAEKALVPRARLDAAWQEGIYRLAYQPLRSRFRELYNASFLEVYNLYAADIALLRKAYLGKSDFTIDVCTDALQQLRQYLLNIAGYENRLQEALQFPGFGYDGIDTNWTALRDLIKRGLDKLQSCRRVEESLRDIRYRIDQGWDSGIYELDYKALWWRFTQDYPVPFRHLSPIYRSDRHTMAMLRKGPATSLTDVECQIVLSTLREYHEVREQLEQRRQEAIEVLGPYGKASDGNWGRVITKLTDFMREIKGLEREAQSQKRARDSIYQIWDFTQIDQFDDALYARFEGPYQDSGFRRTLHAYTRDYKTMAKLHIPGSEPTLEEIRAALEDLRVFHEAESSARDMNTQAEILLGAHYNGLDTDWAFVEESMRSAGAVHAYLQAYGFQRTLLDFLAKPYEERVQDLADLSPEDSFASLERSLTEVLPLLPKSTEFRTYRKVLQRQEQCFGQLHTAYRDAQALLSLVGMTPGDSYTALSQSLERLAHMGESLERLHRDAPAPVETERIDDLDVLFESYYDTTYTASLAQTLAEKVRGGDAAGFSELLRGAPGEAVLPLAQQAVWEQLLGWFPDAGFEALPLPTLIERITAMQDTDRLQLWMQYKTLADSCQAQGLDAYLTYIEREGVPCAAIVPVYQSAILTKWVEEAIASANLTVLQNFHSLTHEKRIQDFKASDALQLQIAKARLMDQLSHEKPSGTSQLVSAMDEVSILRREAEKKRRLTPLRRLFKTIPTLLQKLKPCFMMSPLSVSYFLDSDMYAFDMVIFDEASQILPEDAIGAIYRGRQVIIAGDTKQLPPTNFFAATSRAADLDLDADIDDDLYYPDIVSESILDEANTCLPTCTLLWHYRSRDESLIAFSNRWLYQQSLVTFPNPTRHADRGVEYVYVPDGYYEGSGKNYNIPEAKKCLALVIAHIREHPERSLGIIAFSEKQQAMIEEVISDYRLQNPQYEDFFSETRDEPFFVKNLENVQGDERDTILFSICYAKNAQGRMYQRFGPLGHDGGERRLNVAITRAKYNVKLVGSILPTDISIKEGTKEGVRMLREYIYYAMQNDFSLATGQSPTHDVPIAECVAAFLEEHGYLCARNVGTSQYRVDIAVRALDGSDAYIAGIECDGPNYAQARTARDRDVLRRDIMSSLGWSLYHIWSLAWFLNPDGEKERLLAFLQTAAPSIPEIDASGHKPDLAEMLDAPPIPETPKVSAAAQSKAETRAQPGATRALFERYVPVDPLAVPPIAGEREDDAIARRLFEVVTGEGPIHTEELYRRMAPVFGRSKVTALVRRAVDNNLSQRLSDVVFVRDGFVYAKGMPIQARTPAPGDEARPIDRIAPEELQDALYRVLESAYALPEKDLFAETAKQMGYTRAGPKTQGILSANCKALQAAGRIDRNDGKWYCVR